MMPVTEAFKNAFEANDFECEVVEGKDSDQVQMLVNSYVLPLRYSAERFRGDEG